MVDVEDFSRTGAATMRHVRFCCIALERIGFDLLAWSMKRMAYSRVRLGSVSDADTICGIHQRSILNLGRSAYGPEQCES